MSDNEDCFTFNWQIENFWVLTNTPIDLDSPVFNAHKIKWFLRLHTSCEIVHVSICRSPEANNTKSITIGISTELVSKQTILVKSLKPHETSANDILIQRVPVEALKNMLRSKELQVRCTIFTHEMREMNIPLLHGCIAREEYTVESIGKQLVVARPLVSHAVTRIHVIKSAVIFDVPPISEVNREKSFYLESSLQDWVSLQISVLRKPRMDQMLVRIRRVVIDYSKWTFIQTFSHLIDKLEGQFYRNSFQHCFVNDPDYTWEFCVDIFSSVTTSAKKRKINKAVEKKPGCLRIYLEMLISQEGCYQYSRQDTKCTIDSSTLSLKRDLESMLNLKKNQDTYLVSSDGQTIPVHGYILRARSSVFDRMLTSDMQEKIHRKINLQLDNTAAKAFVNFLYTGHFHPKTAKVACSLLSAGHMYQLTGLIEQCTDFLIQNPTVDCVIDVLTTANVLEDSMLFGTTRKFLVLKAVEVFHSKEWLLLNWNPWLKLEFSLEVLREGMQYRSLDALIDLIKGKQRIALLEN